MVSPTEARDSPRGEQLRRLRVDFKARDIPRGGRGNLKANPVWSTQAASLLKVSPSHC